MLKVYMQQLPKSQIIQKVRVAVTNAANSNDHHHSRTTSKHFHTSTMLGALHLIQLLDRSLGRHHHHPRVLHHRRRRHHNHHPMYEQKM